MSSAAMAADLVSEAPATEDSSPITPILMGSEVCAEAPRGAAAIARTAHPNSHGRALQIVLCMDFLPFLPQEFRQASLRGNSPSFYVQVIGTNARIQTCR